MRSTPEADLREVRQAMLAQLEGCTGAAAASLRLRLACTFDADTLWHLRPRLMEALARERGEGAARLGVSEVDAVFRLHRPGAPVSRPARLH